MPVPTVSPTTRCMRWGCCLVTALSLHRPWWPLQWTERVAPSGRGASSTAAPRSVATRVVTWTPVTPSPHAPQPARERHDPARSLTPQYEDRHVEWRKSAPQRVHHAPKAAATLPTNGTPPFIPPANITLSYRWTQGRHQQVQQLRWSVVEDRYHLSLLTAEPRQQARLEMVSEGRWDATGLHPQRYTVRLPGRSSVAINFLPGDEGDPTAAFSATTFRLTLPRGTQDPLSWLAQWQVIRDGTATPFMPRTLVHPEGRWVELQWQQDTDDPHYWRGTSVDPPETWELWRSPVSPHWPERWRHTPTWGPPAEWTLTHQNGEPLAPAALEFGRRAPISPEDTAIGTTEP